MKIWIVRDGNGEVFLHFKKPVKDLLSGKNFKSYPCRHMINVSETPLETELIESKKQILELEIS